MQQNLMESLLPLQAPIHNGIVDYDALNMDGCLSAIESSTCIAFDAQDFEGKCDSVFSGSLAMGAGCAVDEECANGYCTGDQGCEGTCQPLVGEGEACDPEEQSQCSAGLDCTPTGLCIPKAGSLIRGLEGQVCSAIECAPNYSCVLEDERRCRAFDDVYRLGLDETCTTIANAPGRHRCEDGLLCVFESHERGESGGRCIAMPKAGEPCFVAAASRVAWCAFGSYCDGLDPINGDYSGTCLPYPQEGDACEILPGTDGICSFGSECKDGVCQRAQLAGSRCAVDSDCESNQCNSRVCAPECDPDGRHP